MELRVSQEDVITKGETSFSRTTDTAIPLSVLEEVKKVVSLKMCKVQVSFRQDRTDRPNGQKINESVSYPDLRQKAHFAAKKYVQVHQVLIILLFSSNFSHWSSCSD
jgi:hypothetical protein